MKIEITDTSAGRIYWYFLDGQWVQVAKLTGMTKDEKIALLLGRKVEADGGKTIDVTHWTRAQIVERFLTDGVEAALELLDGTPEEDDEVHRAALRALDGDGERDKGRLVVQTVRASSAVDPEAGADGSRGGNRFRF